jgi:alpha-glucosidase
MTPLRGCRILCATAMSLGSIVGTLWAQDSGGSCTVAKNGRAGIRVTCSSGTIDVEMLESNIFRVDAQPRTETSPRTLVIDPSFKMPGFADAAIRNQGETTTIRSAQMEVSISHTAPTQIVATDSAGKVLVSQTDPLRDASAHRVVLRHALDEKLYGMRGLSLWNDGGGLLRNGGSEVEAGAQGDGGAPFFFTTNYGVLIDSAGGTFNTRDGTIEFRDDSRKDAEYFVVAGCPMQVMSAVSSITGHPPMPPKWTLGFLNSQWGSDEAEIKQIARKYRQEQIPLDAFILDYDWKAWGEDNYGEWRWNSTSDPGNLSPDKFPDGADGVFAKELRAEGIKIAGILKPRIFVHKPGSTTELDEAATYAQSRGLWYPDDPPELSAGRLLRDLDFSKAETRSWYWKHLEPSFDAGMIGWWSDEADTTASPNGPSFYFNNFQFMNMGRMLYEGQRAYSGLRVWSINRNFYLGAQRYGYAEWSGDIQTGFESMQYQRMRMLATLDLGEPNWSMDTGGFVGHPSPENYARWAEFASFVPIDRVHGGHGEKRQPWIYGHTAEAAAVGAIRLRYKLIPYIYSYARAATETGIGIVRPLFWIFPDDPHVVNDDSSWMFGDAFLVSPVVTSGASVKSIYLPPGTWYDYSRGTHFNGGQTIEYKVNARTWQDIPLFVRKGSIIASQPVEQYVDQVQAAEVTIDVFPSNTTSRFVYYDDDGNTYGYERGAYYRQTISASGNAASATINFEAPSGSFRPPLRYYIVKVHGNRAHTVLVDGRTIPKDSPKGQLLRDASTWTTEQDQYGPVTIIRIPAPSASAVALN